MQGAGNLYQSGSTLKRGYHNDAGKKYTKSDQAEGKSLLIPPKYSAIGGDTKTKMSIWKNQHSWTVTDGEQAKCGVCDFTGIINAIDIETGAEYAFKCPYCHEFINKAPHPDIFGDRQIVFGYDRGHDFFGLTCHDLTFYHVYQGKQREPYFPIGVFQFAFDTRLLYTVCYMFCRNFIIKALQERLQMKRNKVDVPKDFMQQKKLEANRYVNSGKLHKFCSNRS